MVKYQQPDQVVGDRVGPSRAAAQWSWTLPTAGTWPRKIEDQGMTEVAKTLRVTRR